MVGRPPWSAADALVGFRPKAGQGTAGPEGAPLSRKSSASCLFHLRPLNDFPALWTRPPPGLGSYVAHPGRWGGASMGSFNKLAGRELGVELDLFDGKALGFAAVLHPAQHVRHGDAVLILVLAQPD